jgi:putative aldouronate transport system substrate-binding protein
MGGEKMLKRVSVLVMVIVLILGMAACAKTEGDVQGTETTTSVQQTTTTTKAITTTVQTKKEETTTAVKVDENPFAEKMEITWLVGTYSSHLYEEGRWDELELEEKFNVDLKMWNIMVDSSNMEQVQMMLAAGDVPDYGFYYTSGQYLYEQGLGRTIPLNMMKEYYPSYYKKLMEDPVGLQFNKVPDKEGEYYGFTAFTCLTTHTYHIPMWRLDWLENIGYEMENLVPMVSTAFPEYSETVYYSTTQFTVDDVKEIYRAFTEDDPDGNGIDDTYGTAFTNTWYDVYSTYGMFGFDKDANHFYKDPVTGDYVIYYAYTPYKDSLDYLMEMLNKGYMRWVPGIDDYYSELIAIWKTGKTGFMNALLGSSILGYNQQAVNRPPLSILETEPTATFVVTPVPGSGKFRPYWTFDWNSSTTYPVGINVSDAKLIRLMQLLEYAYFGEDWLRYKLGIEGVHYVWDSEPFKSSIILTDPEKIPPKYAGKGTNIFGQFGNVNFISDNKMYFNYDAFTNQIIDYYDEYFPGGYHSDNLWIRPDKYYSEFTMTPELYKEFRELRDETLPQINTVHNDFVNKVFNGQIANIHTEWEQYIEQIYAAGLEEWVKIWNDPAIPTYENFGKLP